ncbi:MAG: PRD domain-containing protein [Aerococcaceae bacterium]|nr:PRD domain-containing protein [Aerococcaceae bacterium]
MEVVKVLNNSTVIVHDGRNELVVMGKGISFGKQVGDSIDTTKIEKCFWLDSEKNAIRLAKLLSEIPVMYFELVRDLVDAAETELGIILNETIYLTLTDHIHFAIERFHEGIQTPNAILSEVKTIYQAEYQFSLRVLQYIEQQIGVRLPDDEAGFITLHLIIAQNQSHEADKVTKMTLMVHDMVRIVKEHYQLELDDDDLNYVRFVTHLKFFIMRLWNEEQAVVSDTQLYELVVQHYPKAQEVLPKLSAYLEEKVQHTLSEGESFYLMLHINRLLNRQ